jgi:hypothetical protein
METSTKYYCHSCDSYPLYLAEVTNPESIDFDKECCPYCGSTAVTIQMQQTGNTYTYKQSELPPLSGELQAEIAEIDFQLANLNLKIQGNYHALNSLAETLENNMDSCELAMNSIRIVPDGWQPKTEVTLLDLSPAHKQWIYAQTLVVHMLRKSYAKIVNCTEDEVNAAVLVAISKECKPPSEDDVNNLLRKLIERTEKERQTGDYAKFLKGILRESNVQQN